MASLTRGISFRRQGSSGLSWTDTWTFNEDGQLVRITKEEAAAHGYNGHVRSPFGSSLSRIHDLQDDDEEEPAVSSGVASSTANTTTAPAMSVISSTATFCPTSPTILSRSKSAGSAPMISMHRKISDAIPSSTASKKTSTSKTSTSTSSSSSRVLKWLKKTFGRKKK